MSQQKVDRYKQEKAHRKERLEKEKKRKKLLRICSYFVLAVIVLAIAFAIYRHYTPKTETPAETETTVESVIETTTAEESTVEESTAAKTEDTDTESTSEETADIESAAEETDAAGTESTAADGEAAQAESAAEKNDYHEKTPISGDKWRMIPSSFATGTGVFLFLIIACSQSMHYFLAIKYRSQYSSSLIFSIFTSPPIPSATACNASSVCSILETYTST